MPSSHITKASNVVDIYISFICYLFEMNPPLLSIIPIPKNLTLLGQYYAKIINGTLVLLSAKKENI